MEYREWGKEIDRSNRIRNIPLIYTAQCQKNIFLCVFWVLVAILFSCQFVLGLGKRDTGRTVFFIFLSSERGAALGQRVSIGSDRARANGAVIASVASSSDTANRWAAAGSIADARIDALITVTSLACSAILQKWKGNENNNLSPLNLIRILRRDRCTGRGCKKREDRQGIQWDRSRRVDRYRCGPFRVCSRRRHRRDSGCKGRLHNNTMKQRCYCFKYITTDWFLSLLSNGRHRSNGWPVYPLGQEQMALWFSTRQSAPIPQAPTQGSTHLRLKQARLLLHSSCWVHSG